MTAFHAKGAFSVNSGALSPGLLQSAGITRVAHQINVHGSDNESTARNWSALVPIAQSMPFAQHGGWGVLGPDVNADVKLACDRIQARGLPFYIADTELWWLAGWNVTDMTTRWAEAMRARLGAMYPLGVVSFGYSPSGFPGATLNSGAAVCRRLGIEFIPEGYDFDGVSYGMENVMPYLERDGMPRPTIVAIGDKTVERDSDYLSTHTVSAPVSGVWLWAAEQSGATAPAMARIPLASLTPAPSVPSKTLIQYRDEALATLDEAVRVYGPGVVTQTTRVNHMIRVGRTDEAKRKLVDPALDSIGV